MLRTTKDILAEARVVSRRHYAVHIYKQTNASHAYQQQQEQPSYFLSAFHDADTAQQVAELVRIRLDRSLPSQAGGGVEDQVSVLPPLLLPATSVTTDVIFKLSSRIFVVTDNRGIAVPIAIGHMDRKSLTLLIALYELDTPELTTNTLLNHCKRSIDRVDADADATDATAVM